MSPVTGIYRADFETGEAKFEYTRIPYEHRFDYEKSVKARGALLNYIPIPCGKCIGCRLDYSRKWADRMMLELDHSGGKALFLTLTLDPEHLTSHINSAGIASTDIAGDVSPFIKRLRSHFEGKEIRFFACSEYGSKTFRPHYHAIVYGLSLDDFADVKIYRYTDNNQPIFVSERLTRVWSNGAVFIGSVSWQSCSYVARYALKKLANPRDCKALHIEPERSLMSRRPGIGGYYLKDHPEAVQAFENGVYKLPVSDPNGIKHVPAVRVPKYLLNKLDNLAHDAYNKHKVVSTQAAIHSVTQELEDTGLEEFEYFAKKADRLENKLNNLKRGFDYD